MHLTRDELNAINIRQLQPYVRDDEYFYQTPGREHYQLLAYLSTKFAGQTIFDIGTHFGSSAHALAFNRTNHVHSFDVQDRVPAYRRTIAPNISFHLTNLFDPATREEWKLRILAAALIFIDIEPHDGRPEFEFLQWLKANNYRGTVVFDDIWFFKSMRNNLWYQIDLPKIDVSHIGHWSGTGIVSFGTDAVTCEDSEAPTNWTLVTGYFDLTVMPDANDAIRARPTSMYLDENAHSTLSVEQPLVVFTESKYVEKIWAIRPKHLHHFTKVVAMSFNDFPMTRHRDRIIKNRGGNSGCPSDHRNTASYYLFCVARMAMLKKAIADNTFKSTHFAWINICIERMGYKNVQHLNEALRQQRQKFSTCWINYVPPEIVSDLNRYFDGDKCVGRTGMCSGFFTGNARYMKLVCDKVEEEFMRCLQAGYGHADEQLFNRVYLKHPDLFDWHIGDYQEMITNYAAVYDAPEKPLRNLITGAHDARDWPVVARACDILLASYLAGKCTLSEFDLQELLLKRTHAHAQVKA